VVWLAALSFAGALRHHIWMKAIDQRWEKLSYIAMVWVCGIWVGSFTTEANHGTLSWVTLGLSLTLLPICSFLLVRNHWKPGA
jgi:hypothetical protein